MLRIKPGLLKHLLRKIRVLTVVAAGVACLYALSTEDVMRWQDRPPMTFAFIHSCLLILSLTHNTGGRLAFLYTRGYSRNCLWAHTMAAAGLSALIVWGLAAAIVWTPLRSSFQMLVGNPSFPIMAPLETSVPWVWLLIYALSLPLFCYVRVRRAHPTRGGNGAGILMIVLVVEMLPTLRTGRLGHGHWRILAGVLLVAAAVTLAASRRLHRKVQVLS